MIRSDPSYLFSMVLLIGLLTNAASAGADQRSTSTPVTQVVMLGTGTPGPDPDRSGGQGGLADGTPYLIDLAPASPPRQSRGDREGGKSSGADQLEVPFATHLLSDHTVGYPDLILTPESSGAEYHSRCMVRRLSRRWRGISLAYDEDIERVLGPTAIASVSAGLFGRCDAITAGWSTGMNIFRHGVPSNMPWRATPIGSILPIAVSSSRGTQRQRKRPSMRAMAATF